MLVVLWPARGNVCAIEYLIPPATSLLMPIVLLRQPLA